MTQPYIYSRTGQKHSEPIECSDCRKTIRRGDWVMWDEPSYEYGETDPYCMACTKADQKCLDETDWDAVAREVLGA
jgi:hypothetical protein